VSRRANGRADDGAVVAGQSTIYAVSWDAPSASESGRRQDVAPPEKFIPGGSKPYALNLHNGVIYTATAWGCGGLTNAFYSYDLATRRGCLHSCGRAAGAAAVRSSRPTRPYLGTEMRNSIRRIGLGNRIVGVKLDANKQLQLGDYFAAPNANWLWRRDLDVSTTPVVIDYRNRRSSWSGTSKECRLWLLDRDGLAAKESPTSAYTTPLDLQRCASVRCERRLGA
jgi:hypothetical protein